MTIRLLTKAELSLINKRTVKYKLQDAEKDYFLSLVSGIIYDSPLRARLVFKGGTALYHCYLSQQRFSEDLDFTSLDKSISLEEVKKVLSSQDFLEVKKDFLSDATIKIERLTYAGPLGLPNSLKVEIDFKQNVVLPAREIPYKNVWGVKTNAMVMDIVEIYAEKIRAANERARYRDFYDLSMILKEFDIRIRDAVDLLAQKESRKPLSKSSILRNWKVAKKEKSEEIESIYYSENIPDSVVEKMLKELCECVT